MEQWVPLILTAAASIVASSGFWAYIQKRDNQKGATSTLLMGLAYDKIVSLGLSYIERGWISKDEYEDYRKHLFEPYKAIGGNGVAERIMADVSQLPLRSHGRYAEIIPIQRNQGVG